MLNRSYGKQDKLIMTTLEQLMPKEHFLRDLERLVDFSFIYSKVEHTYSSIGRKSVDPVLLIKMLLLGFLYGIDSERKLEKEVQVNIAFRWFLGIDLDESVPDHSTISQTRRRKWRGTNIFSDIFTEIVRKCIETGLVDGSLLLSDSTHIRANASNDRKETISIEVEPREYVRKLDALCEQEDLRRREDTISKGQKKRGCKASQGNKTREIEKSTTDSDCGILARPGKPKGFHYLSHQTIDGKHGIITDVFVTPANTEDFEPYVDRIKQQIKAYGFCVAEVGLDKGYDYEEIHKEMYDLRIKTYIPIKQPNGAEKHGLYTLSNFQYVECSDIYICPNACQLTLSYINTNKRKKIYSSKAKDCENCPLRNCCIGKNLKCRNLSRSLFKNEIDLQRANSYTKRYFEVQRKRRVYCEGNFAVQKDNHNLRRTRKRGNESVTEHCLCSALALNLKRLVKLLKLRENSSGRLVKILCYSS
jgi:transposase